METSILLGPSEMNNLNISTWPNIVGVPFQSHENGNTFSTRNAVFPSYLEFRKMNNVHTPSDSEC
jgi:hypothetical protein